MDDKEIVALFRFVGNYLELLRALIADVISTVAMDIRFDSSKILTTWTKILPPRSNGLSARSTRFRKQQGAETLSSNPGGQFSSYAHPKYVVNPPPDLSAHFRCLFIGLDGCQDPPWSIH